MFLLFNTHCKGLDIHITNIVIIINMNFYNLYNTGCVRYRPYIEISFENMSFDHM